MRRRLTCRTLALLTALSVVVSSSWAQDDQIFAQQELIQDARQLASILEQSHPDPYINGGGRVAFHRRLQIVLENIPADGMTVEQFYRLLLPFVASLRDGHTALLSPTSSGPLRPGLPLDFKIIDGGLAVASNVEEQDMNLHGALLLGVEGVPLTELVKRQDSLRGIENIYGTLALLTRSLSSEEGLQRLLPDRTDATETQVTLRLADGEVRSFHFNPSGNAESLVTDPDTRVILPDMSGSDIAWKFLDENGKTALLKIDDMSGYREAHEEWIASGRSEGLEMARATYQKFQQRSVPDRTEDILAGIPAATDTFEDLVVAMKNAGTRHLIVDLRENTGGNDLMVPMLLYFLFGKEPMISYDEGFQISRYSDLFFQVYANASLADINRNRSIPLQIGDYDFSDQQGRREERNLLVQLEEADERLSASPTFYKVFSQGMYGNHYRPQQLVVLSSAWTYSSGFSMLAALDALGATVVGTPSAHAGNNFGDSLLFQLTNTELRGAVSYKQNVTFPNDPDKGRCLRPDIMLTYEKWAALNFDPNAEVLLALEHVADAAE